jgi:DNA-binding MurR/RpiR family transcriptional regulator
MDPTARQRILGRLKEDLPDLPPALRNVAKYIVDHPSDFGLDAIRVTARKAGVSTNTLVRLAERLGFSTFHEMRAPFRESLVSAAASVDRPEWVERLREGGALGAVQAEASVNVLAIVSRSLEGLDGPRMHRVVELLSAARTVYVTAARASFALAYYFHYVGRMALPGLQLLPRHVNSPVDELTEAGPGDLLVAITFNPYSRETIEACAAARRRGVTVVLIADSEIVAPGVTSDETLVASVLSTHFFGCYAGAMALLDTLLALLVARGGEASRRRIKSYETSRKENQVYWPMPQKH